VADELPILVGRRIRTLREAAGISQEELAARADLHRNYVGSVERGERNIGILVVQRLATALGLSLAEFFGPFRQRASR
jgi:transcriptional regulator with XRE-family HTH domain